MPYFLLSLVVTGLLFREADALQAPLLQFVAFAAALPVAGLTALFPLVRTLEATAARALCGLPRDAVTEGPATSWATRRRTALWYVLHLLAGGIVSGMTLAAPPAAVTLLLRPLIGIHGPGPLWPGLTGWYAPAAGLGLLALVAGTAWGAGRILAYCAPVLLGPTPADRLAAAERRVADLAVRNRLARELHDSVGHALSAVSLQASAAGRVLDRDPEFVRQALAAIETAARGAVTELDTVLGLLREEGERDGPSSHPAPAPDLTALDGLLDHTRAAGATVTTTVGCTPDLLPPVVSREAYRIVQEGLSNALRHAGTESVRLNIGITTEGLDITVENPLPEAAHRTSGPVRTGGGRGLAGIAERARLLGGRTESGPDDGLWRLAVILPLAADTHGGRSI
ncbi:sensor histidine kinase [Streptomyces sp. UNOC14_S4]|uniref:sensor histidine kinase n=1 Tax=Streptomyces sp. UNOC14_S4 TaxID=2872340 RepID=UPI001E5CF3FE|nr:histidine kinase [Streptomyces sp. UNOC14_S4]MCC3769361.1 histidine kinase [Streptomyces sp. UNOC14_S4]